MMRNLGFRNESLALNSRKSPGLIGCAKCKKFVFATNDDGSLSNLVNHIKTHITSKGIVISSNQVKCH